MISLVSCPIRSISQRIDCIPALCDACSSVSTPPEYSAAKQNKGKHKYSKEALKELKKAMEQIQMIYGSCIRAISGNVDMDIKELMLQNNH